MNTHQKQTLKARAHHMKPIVLLGAKGLTDAVINEVDLALIAHELIKVKINSSEKTQRTAIVTELCDKTQADLVQLIGHTAILYRENNDVLARS